MPKIKVEKIKGFIPVLAAIFGNLVIACIKFLGWLLSGSGVLFSESVHSLADITNQILIMIGIRRSTKIADEEFSYGYGHERFFWAVISACSIFFLGAGITISRGIQALIEKEVVFISPIVFLILGVSFIVELFTFWLAWQELRLSDPDSTIMAALDKGDPSTMAVLYEDGIALIGIAVAFVSIVLTKLTGRIYWDSLGSILIGFLLALMAILLIAKNRRYLIGKAMPAELEEKAKACLNNDPTIEKVLDFKSMTLDVDKYRIKCEVEFNSPTLLKEVYKKGFKEEYDAVKDDYDEFIKFFVNHTDRIPRLVGKKIDELEKKITKEIPEIKHIDIEIN